MDYSEKVNCTTKRLISNYVLCVLLKRGQLLLRQAHALGYLGLRKPRLLAKSLEHAGTLIRVRIGNSLYILEFLGILSLPIFIGNVESLPHMVNSRFWPLKKRPAQKGASAWSRTTAMASDVGAAKMANVCSAHVRNLLQRGCMVSIARGCLRTAS